MSKNKVQEADPVMLCTHTLLKAKQPISAPQVLEDQFMHPRLTLNYIHAKL